MKHDRSRLLILFASACALHLMSATPLAFADQPAPAAISAFNHYVQAIAATLDRQHQSAATFLSEPAESAQADGLLRRGEITLQQLTPPAGAAVPGAMLHHWRGTAFAPGATVGDFRLLMQNYSAYPQRFSPQVLAATVLSHRDNDFEVRLRIRQRHVLSVVLDGDYEVTFGQLDPQHGYSLSRSTQIAEVDSGGRLLAPEEDHGFLWRQNTWWSYEQRDGGLYLQVESISLTRSIPSGLRWAVLPLVESVPRESIEFTLRSVCNALRK